MSFMCDQERRLSKNTLQSLLADQETTSALCLFASASRLRRLYRPLRRLPLISCHGLWFVVVHLTPCVATDE